MSKSYVYEVETLTGHRAKRYSGKRYVLLPDGTELICKTQSQAEALCALINAVVESQESP